MKKTLLHTEQKLLHDFAKTIEPLFHPDGFGPYLVGSAMETRDYRDIDLRVLLPDKIYDKISSIIDLDMLGIAVSLWGQKTTGMPIDYQVQRQSNANKEFKGKLRSAVYIGEGLGR